MVSMSVSFCGVCVLTLARLRRWYAPPPRHLRSLLSAGGGGESSCGRLWCCSCRVVCCVVLVVCLCVWPVSLLTD